MTQQKPTKEVTMCFTTAARLLAANAAIKAGAKPDPEGYAFDIDSHDVQSAVIKALIKADFYPVQHWMDHVNIDNESAARKWLANDEFVDDWMTTLIYPVCDELHYNLWHLVPALMDQASTGAMVDSAIKAAKES
jgi:hypothetical protein